MYEDVCQFFVSLRHRLHFHWWWALVVCPTALRSFNYFIFCGYIGSHFYLKATYTRCLFTIPIACLRYPLPVYDTHCLLTIPITCSIGYPLPHAYDTHCLLTIPIACLRYPLPIYDTHCLLTIPIACLRYFQHENSHITTILTLWSIVKESIPRLMIYIVRAYPSSIYFGKSHVDFTKRRRKWAYCLSINYCVCWLLEYSKARYISCVNCMDCVKFMNCINCMNCVQYLNSYKHRTSDR